MAQLDRRRARIVPIAFEPIETLAHLPHNDFISFVLATEGKASIILNGDAATYNTPVDTIMEYIHIHYMEEIDLDRLCSLVHINRTSLNRMYKARTGQTAMDYLLSYRIRVAQEMLAHTGLTIDEIAHATGFRYDTYLIRQFTVKTGNTPTAYRRAAREKHNIIIHKV